MSKLQVKIDGEWQDFCEAVDKPLVYLEQEEISKIKILTDIRDYLAKKKKAIEKSEINVIVKEVALGIFDSEIVVLKNYAEKLGVEL
jgi:hypothetical protein